MTEDYVSFKTAKLLKEKGFDEPCESAYTENRQHLLSCYKGIVGRRIKNSEALNFSYSVASPTLQMSMKWLRKIKALHIMVDCIGTKNYLPTVQDTKNANDYKVEAKCSKIGGNGFDSYEEACEAAIKYCLENLI